MLALISLGMLKGSRDAASAGAVPGRSCWASGLDILDSWGRTATRSVGLLTQPAGRRWIPPQNRLEECFFYYRVRYLSSNWRARTTAFAAACATDRCVGATLMRWGLTGVLKRHLLEAPDSRPLPTALQVPERGGGSEQQLDGIHGGFRKIRDRAVPGLDPHGPLAAAHRDAGGLDRLAEPVDQTQGAFGPGGGGDDGELGGPQPADGVGSA